MGTDMSYFKDSNPFASLKNAAEFKKLDELFKKVPKNKKSYGIIKRLHSDLNDRHMEQHVFSYLRKLNVPHTLRLGATDYKRLKEILGGRNWKEWIEPNYTVDGVFPKPKKESVEVKESSKKSFGKDYWNKHIKPTYTEEDKLKVQWRNSVTERVFAKVSSKQK